MFVSVDQWQPDANQLAGTTIGCKHVARNNSFKHSPFGSTSPI